MTECADGYDSSDHFHFADLDDGNYMPSGFFGQVAVLRHQNTANYVFVDGHVERLNWNLVKQQLNLTGSRFVNQSGRTD
jgi:prepilin-type processing-associated H-X9-DG protein